MNLLNLDFNIKPFSIKENETICINILNVGLFKISLDERQNKYEVIMHNTSDIKMFNPIKDYNYWLRRFNNLEEAKEYAEEIYKDVLNKLTYNFKDALNDVLEVMK